VKTDSRPNRALAVRHDALEANPVTNVAKIKRKKPKVRILADTAQIAEIRGLIQKWETKDRPGPRRLATCAT